MLQNDQNQLDYAMLPFVMRDLVNMVMKKKMLPLRDALYYIYSSKLYKSLLDLNTKLWYSSTLSLYEALEKEKTEQRKIQGPTQSSATARECVGIPARYFFNPSGSSSRCFLTNSVGVRLGPIPFTRIP